MYLPLTLSTASTERIPRIPRAAWAIILAGLPVHLVLALATDLSPDEAYYLAAARQPGLLPPLRDHPPLLPWLLRLSDQTPLPLELRVRVWAIAFAALTALACVALARRRGAPHAGCVLTALTSTFALLPMAGGFITTPDGPLLFAITLALHFVHEPLTLERSLAAALALALAALAKVVALPIAILLALGATASPPRLRLLLALFPFAALPWLMPSLLFQLHHAFAQRSAAGWSLLAALGAPFAAAFAELLLWSPLVVFHGVRRLPHMPRPELALSLGLTALLLLSALVRALPPEPNWWAPAALVVLLACARFANDLAPRAQTAILMTVLGPSAIAASHVLWPFLPLPVRADPTARLHGWSSGALPLSAPGVGQYGPAAERCVYQNDCEEIRKTFRKFTSSR